MIAIVEETMETCKSDFYKWDLRTLTDIHEEQEFIWCVRRGGTTLLTMNKAEEKTKLAKSEGLRFSFMHSPYCYIDNFSQYSKWSGSRVFFYDGEKMTELKQEQVQDCLDRHYISLVNELQLYVYKYWDGIDGGHTRKVDVHFTSAAFSNVLKIARTSEGAELLNCLKRFRHYGRAAKNHKIHISLDFTDKSFMFHEAINDEMKMNGGIIYSSGKWSIHT